MKIVAHNTIISDMACHLNGGWGGVGCVCVCVFGGGVGVGGVGVGGGGSNHYLNQMVTCTQLGRYIWSWLNLRQI